MKIIVAMKKIKDLHQKAADLREKVRVHGADQDIQAPVYGTEQDQRRKVEGWLKSHEDISQEIAALRVAIMRTNLETEVTIELGGKSVTKSIAEWVVRRGNKREPGLWAGDLQLWAGLTELEIARKGLKDGELTLTQGSQPVKVRIRRYFDVEKRDAAIEMYKSEANVIDAALEVANATTDLVDATTVGTSDVPQALE